MSSDKESRLSNLPNESEFEWENYKTKFNKSYSEEEDAKRKEIFLEGVTEIKRLNALYVEGQSTFTCGVNHMTDLTKEEKSRMCGCLPRPK